MSNFDFKKFLEDTSWDYDKKTIEEMMEKELEKEPEDINMEFVDACMHYLTGSIEKEAPKEKAQVITKQKRIKFSRLLIAAAIIAVISMTGLTVYGNANDMSIKDVFVSLFSDHATIDYSNKNNNGNNSNVPVNETALYKEISSNGINSILLPAQIYNMNYSNFQASNDFASKYVTFNSSETIVVSIEEFSDKKWISNPDVMGNFSESKKINVNGIDIYLFERNGGKNKVSTSISYQIDLTQYDISIDYCSIEQAEEFVSELK